MFFIAAFVMGVVFLSHHSDNLSSEARNSIEDVYGNMSYKGRIIEIHKIRRGGRTYAIACIDLDYSNVEDFHRFDKISAFRIKNNVASLPVGFIGETLVEPAKSILESNYVEVNLQNSSKMVFYSNNKITASKDLYYRSSNLREEDLLVCDNK